MNWNLKGKFLIMHGANRQNNLHVFIYPNAQIYLFGTDGLLGCSLFIYTVCANYKTLTHPEL